MLCNHGVFQQINIYQLLNVFRSYFFVPPVQIAISYLSLSYIIYSLFNCTFGKMQCLLYMPYLIIILYNPLFKKRILFYLYVMTLFLKKESIPDPEIRGDNNPLYTPFPEKFTYNIRCARILRACFSCRLFIA